MTHCAGHWHATKGTENSSFTKSPIIGSCKHFVTSLIENLFWKQLFCQTASLGFSGTAS